MTDFIYDKESIERMLNFSVSQNMREFEVPMKKARIARDPMSHRIIEKRRRDRMNNCLADLSQLIPTAYLKQGQGRIEKTEIIEMAIKHINELQAAVTERKATGELVEHKCCHDRFYLGFKQCIGEVMHFLVEKRGLNARDKLCVDIIDHLQECSQAYLPRAQQDHLEPLIRDEPIPLIRQRSSDCPWAASDTGSTYNLNPIDMGTTSRSQSIDGQSTQSSTEARHSVQDQPSTDSGIDNSGRSTAQSKEEHILQTLLSQRLEVAMPSGDYELNKMNDFLTSCVENDRGDVSGNQDLSSTSTGDIVHARLVDKAGSYKFKNDIKERFTQSAPLSTSEIQAGDSEEEAPNDVKSQKKHSPSPSSDGSTPYPNSEYSSGNGSNTHSSQSASGVAIDGAMNCSVPAFALHPAGTYYIPVVMHQSQVAPFLRGPDPHGTLTVCHPITIPVNFAGPIVSVQGNILSNTQTRPKAEPGYHSHSNTSHWPKHKDAFNRKRST